LGYNSLVALTGGDFNIGIGTNCFNTNLTTGVNNIGLGTNTNMTGNFSNSTAIGLGATITASNQIVLGTATEPTTVVGGLVIGGSKNITLGSGATAPIAGQLGYIYSGTYSGSTPSAPFATGTNKIYSTISAVPAGTYMLFATMTYNPTGAIISAIRGAFQATGIGVIGDSVTYGQTTATSTFGCINISTCFTTTSATALDYQALVNLTFSSGSIDATNSNFVFKMVKIA
jgi:hypothetical protein